MQKKIKFKRLGGRSLKPSHSPQTHFFKHFVKEKHHEIYEHLP